MTTREFNDRLRRKARKVGLTISPELAEGLEAYYRLLELWNDKINLTSLPLREAPRFDGVLDGMAWWSCVKARDASTCGPPVGRRRGHPRCPVEPS